jgi:hypothetical protein
MIESLAARLAARKFVVTGELTPPKGTDLTKLFATAELLRSCVDAINVTESPRARMAMDPRAVALLLQQRGFETIVQITSRDRNRIAIQSDLLGAAALGLRNFVFMGGDSTAGGDHPEAKPVFDLTASGLLAAAEALRNGRDLSGNQLLGTPDLFLGATCNPGALNFDAEIENTRRKIDAGCAAAADAGRLSRRTVATIHRCRQTRWRSDSCRCDSAQVRKEWGVAQRQSAGRGRARGHARSHGTGGEGGAGSRARHRARGARHRGSQATLSGRARHGDWSRGTST